MNKRQKIGIAAIILVLIFAVSVISISMIEPTGSSKSNVDYDQYKITDVSWNPETWRDQVEIRDSFEGRNNIVTAFAGDYNLLISTSFRKFTGAIVHLDLLTTSEQAVELIFKKGETDVFVVRKSPSTSWDSIKIEFNCRTDIYRLTINGGSVYSNKTMPKDVDFIDSLYLRTYIGKHGRLAIDFHSISGYYIIGDT